MDVKTFRDNLFSMNTRRFGSVAEQIIKRLISGKEATNIHHDLRNFDDLRIEVKFSRAEKKHIKSIEDGNVLKVIENEGLAVRMFPYVEWSKCEFDCNIQQIKPAEFDVLFYGLLFADRVIIFMLTPEQLDSPEIKYCDRQHKGNKGEGQFHINPRTLEYHMIHHKFITLSYADLMKILRG